MPPAQIDAGRRRAGRVLARRAWRLGDEAPRSDQLDVFTAEPLRGNPLAVVHDAEGLDDARMAAFARWTNLSETTFLLPPTDPAADYRVRIFTPGGELPFAGHPTLGSCHAWLAAGGRPREPAWWCSNAASAWCACGATAQRLAFAAPPLRRSGPLDPALLAQIARGAAAGARRRCRGHQWVDNGPGWCAVLLRFGRAACWRCGPTGAALGAEARRGRRRTRPGPTTQFEVRAFDRRLACYEDPVTGSLNASLAQWLIGAGLAPPRYVAAQGTALRPRRARARRAATAATSGSAATSATCIARRGAL